MEMKMSRFVVSWYILGRINAMIKENIMPVKKT